MKFKLEFECDNAAFDDLPHAEIARILRNTADKVEGAHFGVSNVYDHDGNKVGHWEIKE